MNPNTLDSCECGSVFGVLFWTFSSQLALTASISLDWMFVMNISSVYHKFQLKNVEFSLNYELVCDASMYTSFYMIIHGNVVSLLKKVMLESLHSSKEYELIINLFKLLSLS